MDPLGSRPAAHHLTDRIGESSQVLQPARHRLDPLRGEGEAVEHGLGHSSGTASGDVGLVGGENGGAVGAHLLGHDTQGGILGGTIGTTQLGADGLGRLGLAHESGGHALMVEPDQLEAAIGPPEEQMTQQYEPPSATMPLPPHDMGLTRVRGERRVERNELARRRSGNRGGTRR